MLNYVSLIIDIESSRKYSIDDRNHMQKFIIECVGYLNKAFEQFLEFPVTFSAGDEMQGLFNNITPAVLYMRIFEMMMHPVRIRAGIGVGEWNVKIENGSSTQQDGPVYHRARRAIEEVRKRQTQRFRIDSDNNDEMINHLINASGSLKEQQGYMQNMAQIIMEFLYPFEKDQRIIFYSHTMRELLSIKYNYKIGMPSFKTKDTYQARKGSMSEELNTAQLETIDPVRLDGMNFDSEAVIIKRNMSSNIAGILGCKRQNADMLIKRGHVIPIREMDYVALQYIERGYKAHGI